MIRWQQAEAVAPDFQRTVKPGAKILQGDCRCQFDDLFGTEQCLNFREYGVRHISRCLCHALSIAQRGFFSVIKVRTRLEDGELR